MLLESDFYMTPSGKKHFADNILSIQLCVQETCNFDGIYAYLTCQNYDYQYDVTRGLTTGLSLLAQHKNDIAMYAVVQKDGRGFDRAVESAKAQMARYHVKPNMLIVPPELLLYVTMVPDERTQHLHGGDLAVKEFRAGVSGFQETKCRGLDVYTVTPFDVGEQQAAVQMLRRTMQVGEYYVMGPHAGRSQPLRDGAGGGDILIYNEPRDQMDVVQFKKALTHTCWLQLGNDAFEAIKDEFDVADKEGDNNLQKAVKARAKKNLERSKKSISGTYWDEDNIDALYNHLAAQKPKVQYDDDDGKSFDINEKIAEFVDIGGWLPIAIVLARPFIEHSMLSAVVTVAGADTGSTLYGPADMQLSSNTQTKVIEGHFTCHTKALVSKPENVFVQRDIMSGGYLGGRSTMFFADGNPSAQNIKEALNARFEANYEEEMPSRARMPSMLAYLVPTSDGFVDNDGAFDLRGGSGFPGGEGLLKGYNDLFGEAYTTGQDMSFMQTKAFLCGGTNNNSLCIMGPHRRIGVNAASAEFDELVPGQGHWGADALPGDARWMSGETVDMRTARAAMHHGAVNAASRQY